MLVLAAESNLLPQKIGCRLGEVLLAGVAAVAHSEKEEIQRNLALPGVFRHFIHKANRQLMTLIP